MRQPRTPAHAITHVESLTLGPGTAKPGDWSRRQFALATLTGCLTVQPDANAAQGESVLPWLTAEHLLATIAVGPGFVAGDEKVEALGQGPNEPARFSFVGDLQLQLKFTLPPSFRGQMVNASMAALAKLGLSPQKAFELAGRMPWLRCPRRLRDGPSTACRCWSPNRPPEWPKVRPISWIATSGVRPRVRPAAAWS